MSFVNNSGVRIHYQVEGAGPPLVLHHGMSDSLASWQKYGYAGPLKKDYQLWYWLTPGVTATATSPTTPTPTRCPYGLPM
jgi:pimeloyl-ACP methyl ester carboxylesterase